jgi:hypothetical protein
MSKNTDHRLGCSQIFERLPRKKGTSAQLAAAVKAQSEEQNVARLNVFKTHIPRLDGVLLHFSHFSEAGRGTIQVF